MILFAQATFVAFAFTVCNSIVGRKVIYCTKKIIIREQNRKMIKDSVSINEEDKKKELKHT